MSNYVKAFLIVLAFYAGNVLMPLGGGWLVVGGAVSFLGGWELGAMAKRLDALERAS